jgi:hypothetical protein
MPRKNLTAGDILAVYDRASKLEQQRLLELLQQRGHCVTQECHNATLKFLSEHLLAGDAVNVPAKQAQALTGLSLSHLSKLAKKGRIRSQSLAGNRRLVNLTDVARYVMDKNL